MSTWNNFFLQKMGEDSNGHEYPVMESVSSWGVYCCDIPFILVVDMKEPAKRDWYDEDGTDEYIPADGLKADSYTMKVKFGCKPRVTGSGQNAVTHGVRENVGAFLTYLREAGNMKMYSSWTGIGRQNVRLKSVDDNATWEVDASGGGRASLSDREGEKVDAMLVFEVEFKVNDPVTDVVLIQNS